MQALATVLLAINSWLLVPLESPPPRRLGLRRRPLPHRLDRDRRSSEGDEEVPVQSGGAVTLSKEEVRVPWRGEM